MNIQKINSETYNKIALDYNDRNPDHFWIKEFNFFKNTIKGKKVIDLGCGAGRDVEVFLKNDFNCVGIDTSRAMLNIARKRVPNGKFMLMDISKTSFPDKSFDGFWAAASFLHIPKKELPKILNETKRLLKKDGLGFISVKEKTSMDEGIIKESRYNGMGRYFAFYTSEELRGVLEGCGFNVIKSGKFIENDEGKTHWLTFFVSLNK